MPKRPKPVEAVTRLLADDEAFGTVVLTLCVDVWGTECLHDPEDPDRGPWHPATFAAELRRHFGVDITPGNLHRLMAAATVVTTDLFWKDARAFVALANVLAGDEFTPDVWEKADAAECAWAITEALLLDPPDDGDPDPFVPEIRRYVAAVLKDEGFVTPPDVLKIALDADISGLVSAEFADDPEMFQGIYQVQQDKAADVEAVLRDRLLEFRDQLASLPLSNGSTAELERRIEVMLRVNAPEDATGPEHVLS